MMIEDAVVAVERESGGGVPRSARGARIRVEMSGSPRGPRQSAEPITLGVPFARGLCANEAELRLLDDAGRATALQTQVLDRWPDGSIRWVLVDFQHQPDRAGDFILRQSTSS